MSSLASQRVLRFADGPLVWVDCEMTGLDPQKDKILGMLLVIYIDNGRRNESALLLTQLPILL